MNPVTLIKIDLDCPVGTPVIVIRDNETLFFSSTRSVVELTGGVWVVFIDGISGFYLADRVYDASELKRV